MSPTTILLIILLLSALGIVGVLLSLKRKERQKRATIKERIRPYVDQAYREELARQRSVQDEAESVTFLEGIADKLSDAAISEEIREKMRDWLLRAGLRVRPAEYVIICFIVMIITGLISGFLSWLTFSARVSALGLVGFALGWIFPVIYVWFSRIRRMKKFNGQLLDLITLMANGLKSGYGFVQALNLVSEEASPPASEEFNRVIQENKYGISIEDALNKLVERMDSEDLDLLVTAILIQRQVGGNLSEVLDQISTTIRERMKMQGQISALTAQGKMGGMIISLLPVALGLVFYFIRTEMMTNFITNRFGIAAICFGVFWQGIGIFAIWQIVNIDV